MPLIRLIDKVSLTPPRGSLAEDKKSCYISNPCTKSRTKCHSI